MTWGRRGPSPNTRASPCARGNDTRRRAAAGMPLQVQRRRRAPSEGERRSQVPFPRARKEAVSSCKTAFFFLETVYYFSFSRRHWVTLKDEPTRTAGAFCRDPLPTGPARGRLRAARSAPATLGARRTPYDRRRIPRRPDSPADHLATPSEPRGLGVGEREAVGSQGPDR